MSDEITHQFPHGEIRAHITQLDKRLIVVEEKVERKLMETQPIWSHIVSQFDVMNARFDSLDQQITVRFDSVDARLDRVEKRLDLIEVRLDRVEERLDRVEVRLDRVEERLGVVGVRLEKVEGRLDQVEVRLEKVETRLDKVETTLGKVQYELYGLGKKFRVLNREILDVQNAHEDLDERVSLLEIPTTEEQ